ncbi:14-3-3 protein [Viridothelium virens]|uniref:14-3-3 protein n=1 Tax=Viridothelium virens TaxID=1048519 RepID=A0A6A6HBH7_VIRVR|nr:14-3-3 protein [Viridothelium virens]
MATSDVEQKILGRLANITATKDIFLSKALQQVLGLSVMLAKKLRRARKLRRLDPSRDTKSLQLYHHILWLSREGLSIVELDVLPYTQNGEQGHECRVMSCKLRASFYHIFCLFHNNPPVSTLSIPSQITLSPDNPDSPPQRNGQRRSSNGKNGSSRHGKKASLRDAIPSLQSDISYITNPYALTGATPPPQSQNPQTPSRPPGLPPKPPIPSSTAFILPPLNFLPITTSAFTTTSSLASSLLPGSHPLRLSVALEHSAFLWDCAKEFDRSRRVAYRAISDVWNADEGMDDVEFEDARELVSLLGGMMKRGLPKASSSGGTQGERSARDSGARSGTEDITAIRRGGEGSRLASSPGQPTATSSRQSPPKQSRSGPPGRQDSRGTSSTTPKAATTPSRTTSRRSPPSRQDRGAPSNITSKATPTSSRITQRRSSPSRQDRGVPSSTPPRPMTSGINTTSRSSPRRQESYGTASSTPRPPTAIRDSPHLRPPTAGKDKELPPTPEEWTRIGYLGEPRYNVGRRGAHERTPPSAARISRGGSATSQHPNTPQARTPPTQLRPGNPDSGESRASQEPQFQTPQRPASDRRGSGAVGEGGSRSGGSGSRSGGSSSHTRGGSVGQRASGDSGPREEHSSQTTPRSGAERHSGESRHSSGSGTPRATETQRGGRRRRWF